MKLYSWDDLKERADCRDIAVNMLGMQVKEKGAKSWKFSNPWRAGSDSSAFSVMERGYHDFVSDEKGSALDLVANAKFNGDIMPAQEALGEYLHATPCNEAKPKRQFVCAYDYKDAAGNLVHQTVRYASPKSFSQRRPDPNKAGEWINSLSGIEPVLYQLPDLIETQWVCVVGGEKDADNLRAIGIPATTNPMGEGNWRDSYNPYFNGKVVIILPDQDEVGWKHGQVVAFAVRDIAKSVRIINLPFPDAADPRKDASDWIDCHRAAGHTNDAIADSLKAIIKKTDPIDAAKMKEPESDNEAVAMISKAKQANKKPFSNFDWGVGTDDKGKEKKVKYPRHINVLMKETSVRFLGFPCRVGSTLFDHDKDSREIHLLERPSRLFGWIQEKSKQGKEWCKAEGFVTEDEFFSSLCSNAKRYEAISGVPNWPVRPNVYYTHGKMPTSDPACKKFNEFCQFFSPASEVDWHMLRAFIASPLYWKYKVMRPVWIIDSRDGQGAGKTTLASMTAFLYGGDDQECGEPNWIAPEKLNNEMMMERVLRELLSGSGRKKRMAIVDNVVGYFKCPELARLITQSSLTGMAPYGHGQETRPNDLTWVITSNSATVDPDISNRAIYVKVCKPKAYIDRWTEKVVAFIQEHRLQIISDIIGILDRGPQFQFTAATRFKDWEYDVLAPILGDQETWETVTGVNAERQHESDGEIEDAATIRDMLKHRLEQCLGTAWNDTPAWIQSSVMATWVLGAIPKFAGGSTRGCVSQVKNMVKVGRLNELSCDIESWPHRGKNRHRGFMFNGEKYKAGARPYIIGVNGDGSITTALTPENEC